MNRRDPGPVLIGIAGTELTDAERDRLAHSAVGGVVLFTRNYDGPTQLGELVQSVREATPTRLLICVDHEGGRVQRFRNRFTRLPPLGLLGRMHRGAPELARDYAYRHARVMATELLLLGLDLSFAPVLDLDVDSCVIGDRAFSADPAAVIDLARHYLAGLRDAGMGGCGKHFPGHGSVRADSHVDDVVDPRPWAEIEATDLRPFRALAPRLDAVMMAHVVYPQVDARPAGYSERWIQGVLREELAFEGVVFSDDLGMHAAAAAGKLADRLWRSLEAGCDAVLVCEPMDVETLFRQLGDGEIGSCPALLNLAGRNTLTAEEVASVAEWRHWQESLKDLEHSQWA